MRKVHPNLLRILALFTIALVGNALLPAQIPSGYVQTTATVTALANGTFGAAWTNLSTSPQLGLLGCVSTFQQSVTGRFDAYGHISTLLADTAQICPSPSTWTFTFTFACATGQVSSSFMIQVPVTGGGGTEDISTQIRTALPSTPCSGGGGGGGGGGIGGSGTPGDYSLWITPSTLGNGHLNENDNPGTITATEPFEVVGTSGFSGYFWVTGGNDPGGVAGQAWYTTDSTNGYAMVNEGHTARSRICTAANSASVPGCGSGGGSGITQLTGDGTAGPGSGSQALTLATVNGSPGTCGDSTHVCQVTTNGKGLVTAQSAVLISGGGGGGGAGQFFTGSVAGTSPQTYTLVASAASNTMYYICSAWTMLTTTGTVTSESMTLSWTSAQTVNNPQTFAVPEFNTSGVVQPTCQQIFAQAGTAITLHLSWTGGGSIVTGNYYSTIVSGSGTIYYQTVQANGTSQTQEPKLNLKSGTNATVSCTDNSGAGSTDCTVSASGGGGYPTPVTVSGTGVTELDLTSCITSSQRDYDIRFSQITWTSGSGVTAFIQFSSDNGSTWDTASNYFYARAFNQMNGGTTGTTTNQNSGGIVPSLSAGNTSNAGDIIDTHMTLYFPRNATSTKMGKIETQINAASGGPLVFDMDGGWWYTGTGSVNAVRLITTGAFTGQATCQPLPQ